MDANSVTKEYDLIVIGSGMGGGTLVHSLQGCGLRIGIVERGGFLPREEANWNPVAVFLQDRYKPGERWLDKEGREFSPGIHYFVGGNTKVYGAALLRLRRRDFEELEHAEGVSPAWPITYADLEPYYATAERLFFVHGESGTDPTEPERSTEYPYPALPNERFVEEFAANLRRQGLHPSPLPLAVDLNKSGRCIRCRTCDGFPCKLHAKGDAEVCCILPALQDANVELIPNTRIDCLRTNSAGDRVEVAVGRQPGRSINLFARYFVLAAGAINSAVVLLRSASKKHPLGLANSSGLVGRNYMMHNNSAIVGVSLARKNNTTFQKTLQINDFYFSGGSKFPFPLGNLQMLGKVQAAMLKGSNPWLPNPILKRIAQRSIDLWAISEDLPDPNNQVVLTEGGRISVRRTANNSKAHRELLRVTRRLLVKSGFPVVLSETVGIASNSHQCGTLRFGTDPGRSVLDVYCRTHDVENLSVVDASFFPSSAAVNPALTVAAQALRVGEQLRKTLQGATEIATSPNRFARSKQN